MRSSLEGNRRLDVPRVPELPTQYVARPRLHRRLDEATDTSKVIQIVAPAVSGKTTLLSGWHASGTSPSMAYLFLDALDNEPHRFWTRVVGALEALHPGWKPAAGAGLADVTTTVTTTRFVDDLVADLNELDRTVLVLDAIDNLENLDIARLLGLMLIELSGPLKVILAGRSEVHLRQGLLRARGQLVDIHASELAFDVPELKSYLAHFGDLGLAEADVHALHERTEGWIGGVKLATLALAAHPVPSAFIHGLTGSSRYIADLLEEEVLEPQPPDVRDFLLATSVLETLDELLCDAVTGSTGSAARLERLTRAGLFVESIDDHRTRYRYWPLFGEFLRHQLHLQDPAREKAAHQTAAAVCEARGDISGAVGHFVAGEAPREAVRLVVEHGPRYAAMGKVDTLRGWLASFPDDFLTNDLRQMLDIARLCIMAGMRDEATTWLARARWRVEATGDGGLVTEHALLSGYAYATLGNLEAAVGEAHRVLMLAEGAGEVGPTLRGKAHHLLAGTYAGLDEFELARRHRDLAPPDIEAEVPTEAYSAWLDYREGQLDRAMEHANRLLASSSRPWQWGIPLIARGGVRRERNQLGEAEIDLVRARELAEHWSRPRQKVFCAIELGLLRFAQGRSLDAIEIVSRARPHAHGPNLRQRVDATLAGLYLRQGDVERCISTRRDLTDARLIGPLDVRIALATGEVDAARELCSEFAAATRSLQERIVARLLTARLVQDDDEARALSELGQAIELGRPERFVQAFVEDLPALEPLMRRLLVADDDPYAFGLLAAVTAQIREASLVPTLIEPLSSREEVVLRYLQTRLSNKEIAAELHMSVNTLKTHLKNIYRKLNVTSRAEAVTSARLLRML